MDRDRALDIMARVRRGAWLHLSSRLLFTIALTVSALASVLTPWPSPESPKVAAMLLWLHIAIWSILIMLLFDFWVAYRRVARLSPKGRSFSPLLEVYIRDIDRRLSRLMWTTYRVHVVLDLIACAVLLGLLVLIARELSPQVEENLAVLLKPPWLYALLLVLAFIAHALYRDLLVIPRLVEDRSVLSAYGEDPEVDTSAAG